MGREISAPFKDGMTTVHNGFIEVYVNGGIIGLSLLVMLLAVWGWWSFDQVISGSLRGRVAVAVWTTALFYNNSETIFFRMGPFWFTLLLMMIRAPSCPAEPSLNPSRRRAWTSEDSKSVHNVQTRASSRREWWLGRWNADNGIWHRKGECREI